MCFRRMLVTMLRILTALDKIVKGKLLSFLIKLSVTVSGL